MKTKEEIVGAARAAIAVLAFATAIIPVLAVGKSGAVATEHSDAIHPFHVNIPDEALADLRRRIAATRWPERETVTDQSQGVPLAKIQELMRYWGTDYDWRKAEAKLNALPQFVTELDGLDIQFVHVRSRHPNAMLLIIAHGWPGSIFEQLKIIDPLANPTAHGASASDAFHVVIPSMPGYGFSGKPTTTGWDPARIARAWVVLMKRLGYTRFVAQGGDWSAVITDVMAQQASPELLGIHTNMAGAVPPDVSKAIASGGPVPSGLSDEERRTFERLKDFFAKGVYYAYDISTKANLPTRQCSKAAFPATRLSNLATLSSPVTHLDTENHSRKE